MGITIAYRGQLADLARVEDFEDRLIDFALEVGGQGQIWRSRGDETPERMVRGVVLNLAPGLESTSLLLSPEGWLINLIEIEDAERGLLKEAPWCFTKTQFGPVEGHVALIEMFAALKREFLPGLEVKDEGGYWETRDLAELKKRRAFLNEALEQLAEDLRNSTLSPEAAEDPDILARRIQRVAAQVQRTLMRPSEHAPVTFGDEEEYAGEPDPAMTEAMWDEMYKHNRRQQERMQRSIEERRRQGEDHEEAFEKALEDLGLDIPGDDEDDEDDDVTDEAWRGNEPASFESESESDPFNEAEEDESLDEDAEDDGRHPLIQAAMDLLHRLHTVFAGADRRFEPALQALFQGAGDTMGGLAQAVSRRAARVDDDRDTYGLHVVQLKRALRGAAFARGSLFSVREAAPDEVMKELHEMVGRLEKDIFAELSRLREEHGAGEE